MANIEVGVRIDPSTGVAFFGVEAVNAKLAAGLRIKEIKPGGLLMTQVKSDGQNTTMAFHGCQIVVVFEGD